MSTNYFVHSYQRADQRWLLLVLFSSLGIDKHKGTLQIGTDADFIMLDNDLNVINTYIAGECVFQSDCIKKQPNMIDAGFVLPTKARPSHYSSYIYF